MKHLALMVLMLPLMSLAAKIPAEPVFSREVAPILFKNCAACHRPGEVAPMSLLNYQETRPWAKAIKKAVASRKMPPWGADTEPGQFHNDLSLSREEIETLAEWVDAGAPEGNPADLPPVPQFPSGWKLGEPDYIIELGEFKVHAQGEDLFPNIKAHINMPEDRWVRAIEFAPGDKRVVHHILTILGDFSMNSSTMDQAGITEAFRQAAEAQPPEIFQVWVAGAQPTVYPEGMGRIIKKDQIISMNIHYHPCGTETTDRSRIGLYFGKGEMKKRITTNFAVNTGFLIPPGAPNHEVQAFHVFDQDSRIVSFMPHMHTRGKDMRYDLILPDGSRRTVLNVPRYDYNWQWIYYPNEAIAAPKGSRVEVVAHYDNSTGNANNPDAKRAIEYRDATTEEMFVAFMEFIVDDGVEPKPLTSAEKLPRLLAQHDPKDRYTMRTLITSAGLYVPRAGDGMMYVVSGNVMFTSTLRSVVWEGESFKVLTSLPTPGGGGISAALSGSLDAAGQLNGKMEIGVAESAADPAKNKIVTLPFRGQRETNPAGAAGGI